MGKSSKKTNYSWGLPKEEDFNFESKPQVINTTFAKPPLIMQ